LKDSRRIVAVFLHCLKSNQLTASLLLTACLFCQPATAQITIHVPADQPTIQAGINAASNGDTVLVAPGTYKENIDFKGKGITVTSGATSYSGAAATVITAAGYGSVVNLKTNEPSTAVLNGFTIQDASGPTANTPVAGVLISGSSPTITNNVVQQNIACGIAVLQGASPTIQGNDIRQNRASLTSEEPIGSCGGVAGTGLYINGGGTVTVTGNIIEQNNVIGYRTTPDESNGAGISLVGFPKKLVLINNIVRNNAGYFSDGLSSGDSDTDNTVIMIQNLFYTDSSAPANSDSGVGIGGGNIYQPPFPTVIEINNTIYSDEGLGGGYAPGSVLGNNIFDDVSTKTDGGLSCEDLPSLAINNNDIVPPSSPDVPCPLGVGNISIDPQFISSTSGNFQVQRSSPVVGAGDITAPMIPVADLAGKNRTVCGRIDMGVYELHPQPSIAVTSSNNPSVGSTSVTFNTQVPGNCNIPTGTVTFMDGSTVLGTVTLTPGAAASLTTSSLTVGTHTITVTYPGDFNFDPSISSPLTQVVTGFPSSTSLSVSPNPADAFAPIQLSSTVSSKFGTPTGTVAFTSGTTTLATIPLNGSGYASTSISTLGAGTYNIVATYSADTNFAASSSTVVVEKVIGANSAVTLTASPNPATFGQTVSFRAVVRPTQGNAIPSGNIVFIDGSTTLGSASLDATGSASLSVSTLSIGTHAITASYSGSPNFDASASAVVNEIITAIPTSITLNVSPNPANLGQSISLIAQVSSILPSEAPTGTVIFSDQNGVLGSSPFTGAAASLSISTLSAGTHQITAALNPTGNFAPSASPSVAELITAYDFSLTASSASLTIPPDRFQVLTITVTPIGGFPRSVNLACTQVPLHALCNLAQSTTNPLSNGPQTIKLTISTSDLERYGSQVGSLSTEPPALRGSSKLLAGLFLPILLLCRTKKEKSRHKQPTLRLLSFVALIGLGIALQGCSGRLPESTPPGDYLLQITAADSGTALTHAITLNLRVP
jgi:parallel beta-helix repeat protein/putative cofactor-binding repeat protein